MVEICVLCGWRFLNHFDIVSEISCSRDTVGCELQRIIVRLLLYHETDWKIRVGKQGYVFYVFYVSFLRIPGISLCNNYFETENF